MSNLLICSSPVQGHLQPLLAAARHLVEQGHDVRFLTGSRYRGIVEATGSRFLPLPESSDFDDSDLEAAFPRRAELKGLAKLRYDIDSLFLGPARGQAAAIDAAMAAQRVDMILAEPTVLGAGAIALRASRPPIVQLGMVPLCLKSRDTAPFGLGLPPKPGAAGRIRNGMLNALAQRVLFKPNQASWQRLVAEVAGVRTDVYLLDWASVADAVVQFTVPEFEYPRSDAPGTLHFVGPVSRTVPSTTPLPSWWSELDGSRPIVHVTQGTIANKDWNELIAPAMAGLAGEDVLVVVSTGRRPIETLPHPLPANVRVAEFLPYDRLLPRTDVLVTNGGYGGVHYALEHGVPLVVAGTSEDKAEVTARVAWSGTGINLRTDAPTPEAVRDAVRAVLREPQYRQASAAIGRAIAASPGLAGLDSVVHGLLRQRVTVVR